MVLLPGSLNSLEVRISLLGPDLSHETDPRSLEEHPKQVLQLKRITSRGEMPEKDNSPGQ